jgi:lysyl-tRNA synthetase class 2
MATLFDYPTLPTEEVLANQSFWQSGIPPAEGMFCARLLEDRGRSLLISYNHKSFTIHINERIGLAGISPGHIIKCHYSSVSKTSDGYSFQKAELKILVPTGGPGLFTGLTAQRLKDWQNFLQLIRNFFVTKGFEEFRTPALVTSPGIEEHIDVFSTEFFRGSLRKKFYLPTSPEFHLKKALSMGWNQVFEMKECFRNDEGSPIHQPEFLMLEWYRAYSNLEFILNDTKDLLRFLAKNLQQEMPTIEVKSVTDLFKEFLDFELTTETSIAELKALLDSHKLTYTANDSWDDLYFRIFIEKIEPHLGQKAPILVTKYPHSQAALARLTKDGWADRFELYWKGIELANAFHELNDVNEQQKRFEKTNEKRCLAGRESLPIDEDFMKALSYGLPPSGGIALGVERLFMCFYGIDDIREVRGFTI